MTKEVYNTSVDVLLDAHNNGTLFHGNCAACAVGNLVVAACGYSVDLSKIDHSCTGARSIGWGENSPAWDSVFVTGYHGQDFDEGRSEGESKRQIDSTEIPLEELAEIEEAFELALYNSKEGYAYWVKKENMKQGQYMGLCAVLDVMAKMVDDVPVKENQSRLDRIAEKFSVVV